MQMWMYSLLQAVYQKEQLASCNPWRKDSWDRPQPTSMTPIRNKLSKNKCSDVAFGPFGKMASFQESVHPLHALLQPIRRSTPPQKRIGTVDQTHYRCESQARLKPRLLSCPAGYHSQASHSFHVPHSNLTNPLGKTETILANFLLTWTLPEAASDSHICVIHFKVYRERQRAKGVMFSSGAGCLTFT